MVLASCTTFAQVEEYQYTREIKGVAGQWHKVILPDDLFGKVSDNLYDLRIYGITEAKDTIEAPYLLQLSAEKVLETEITFRTLNASQNAGRYFYTFEIPSEEGINRIKLNFKHQNFDWRITLEGSQNQQEWFTITENYRILSLKNELTDFKFTTLNFPESRYRFFRISLESDHKPQFQGAKIFKEETYEGSFKNYPIEDYSVKENRKARITELSLELSFPVPVSHIKINVKDTFDYYRPITIKYLEDSIKTEQGWKYNYRSLASGTLNSLEENTFKFNSTILKKLQIEIYNADNRPLHIGDIEVKGYEYAILARFTEPADYFLAYGRSNTRAPQYDLERFTNRIPDEISLVTLNAEQSKDKRVEKGKTPLFENKMWLWVAILLVILLLGLFTVKMIKEK